GCPPHFVRRCRRFHGRRRHRVQSWRSGCGAVLRGKRHRPSRARADIRERAGRPPGQRVREVSRMSTPIRLTVVQTHPVQYLAPWFRYVSTQCAELDLTVIYASRPAAGQQGTGFDRAFEWDTPLLTGYRWEIVRESRARDDFSTAGYHGLDV